MGYVRSKHNKLILELLSDTNYFIAQTGQIFNKDGVELGYVLTCNNKSYRYLKYKGKALKIHRIIHAKFLGELVLGKVIHHKDGNGLNNHVTNLEQITQLRNVIYRYKPQVVALDADDIVNVITSEVKDVETSSNTSDDRTKTDRTVQTDT